MKANKEYSKAVEFVKTFGIEAAQDLWVGAFDFYNNNIQILNGMVCRYSDDKFLFDLLYIKGIIESHAMVESYGGLEKAKIRCYPAKHLTMESYHQLKQAILDVESCQ